MSPACLGISTLGTRLFLNPLEFIQFTPKSNCGECGQATCLAFAVAVTRGGADPSRCPYVDPAGLKVNEAQAVQDGNALDRVDRGQNERDMALVAYLKSKISDLNFGHVASLFGARWHSENPDVISFQYLGRSVELSKDDVRLDGGELVDPRDQILLYNYVSSGGGDIPLENWVGMESLPNSISKVRTLSVYCEQPLARRFSGRSGQLARICSQVGALPGPEGQSATLGVIIPVLPRVVHYLLFWDEEPEDGFDSRVKVLFDDHVLDFLDIESLVFSAERMAERVMELDS